MFTPEEKDALMCLISHYLETATIDDELRPLIYSIESKVLLMEEQP